MTILLMYKVVFQPGFGLQNAIKTQIETPQLHVSAACVPSAHLVGYIDRQQTRGTRGVTGSEHEQQSLGQASSGDPRAERVQGSRCGHVYRGFEDNYHTSRNQHFLLYNVDPGRA